MEALASLVGHLLASFGHSPACLQKFNVRRIMFLWVTNEGIVDFQISFTLSGVSYALKWVTTGLECYYALIDSETMVSWFGRA